MGLLPGGRTERTADNPDRSRVARSHLSCAYTVVKIMYASVPDRVLIVRHGATQLEVRVYEAIPTNIELADRRSGESRRGRNSTGALRSGRRSRRRWSG